MTPLFFDYPSWIHPSIFPGVPFLQNIRWYGLMYIFAFATAYFFLLKLLKEGALNPKPGDTLKEKPTEDDLFSFLTTGIIGLLLGARIFSTLIYSTGYWSKPWLIFWPFDSDGHFTGLAGMSYHGGFIGCLVAIIIWCKIKKRPLLRWLDTVCIAIPLGYTFGRLGNFLNGELYGRITTSWIGMRFKNLPLSQLFDSTQGWVQDFAEKCGIDTAAEKISYAGRELINLPRHPSQLYEAFFEGIVLFLILWFLRKKKPFDGFMTGLYTIGYGFFRFVIEYFRQPDADIGYRFSANNGEIYEMTSLLNISTGQILCFIMILGGAAFIAAGWYLNKKSSTTKDKESKNKQ